MKEKILITRRIPAAGLAVLRKYRLQINELDRPLHRRELLRGVVGQDAVLCTLNDGVDAAVMDAAGPRLKIIANYAAGYNNIDVAAAAARGITVSNTPDVLTAATADLTWALLLSVARRVPVGDRFTRAGKFRGWGPLLLLGHAVSGRTLGIIGLGRIGQAVAERARGFAMNIIYSGPRRAPRRVEKRLGAAFVEPGELLRRADYLSLHVPLNGDTRHMIGARELRMMKRGAYLINTSRGAVVDEQALVRALRRGRIAGAALDVYEHEPELAPGLAGLDNVVLLPHLGSATQEARTQMAVLAARNIAARLQGRRAPNSVGPLTGQPRGR